MKKSNSHPRSVSARLDAESRRLAQKIHKLGYIYAAYGALDGLSTAISEMSLGFALACANSDSLPSDMMHDWLMTPAGIAVAATESITLITFSLLANLFSDDDKNAAKRFFAIAWPPLRDTLKGMKNAYKGIRSTLQAYGSLLGQNVRYMIVPFGLALGVLSVVNRIFMRNLVREPRKVMMKKNAKLLLEVQAIRYDCIHSRSILPTNKAEYKNSYILVNKQLYYIHSDETVEEIQLTPEQFDRFLKDFNELNPNRQDVIRLPQKTLQNLIELNGGCAPAICDNFRKRIMRQSPKLCAVALLGAAYGGVVDGLYLFMGALGLAALASPALLAMTVFCTFFSVMCIAMRVYEEYDFQRQLLAAQAKIELDLLGKESEALYAKLQRLSNPCETPQTKDLTLEQEKTMDAFEEKLDEFRKKQAYLQAQIRLSYTSAALAGLKNGLSAYCAIASVMFSVATVYAILLVPFPPAFLISCVVAGMACLIGFVVHSLIANYEHLRTNNKEQQQKKDDVKKLILGENYQETSETPAQEKMPLVAEEPKKKTLLDIILLFKENRAAAKDLKPTELKEALLEGMVVDPSPQFFFQEWFEVVRSFFSGFSKGQKSVDYTLNALQEQDQQGHYHDTPVMFVVTAVSAVIHAVALSARAHARGFGRPNISDASGKKTPGALGNVPHVKTVLPQTTDAAHTHAADEDELSRLHAKDTQSRCDGSLGDETRFTNRERSISTRPHTRSPSWCGFWSSTSASAPLSRSLSTGDLSSSSSIFPI